MIHFKKVKTIGRTVDSYIKNHTHWVTLAEVVVLILTVCIARNQLVDIRNQNATELILKLSEPLDSSELESLQNKLYLGNPLTTDDARQLPRLLHVFERMTIAYCDNVITAQQVAHGFGFYIAAAYHHQDVAEILERHSLVNGHGEFAGFRVLGETIDDMQFTDSPHNRCNCITSGAVSYECITKDVLDRHSKLAPNNRCSQNPNRLSW